MSIRNFCTSVIVGLVLVFSISLFASAFTGPTQSPPNGSGAIATDGLNVSLGTSTILGSTKLYLAASSSAATDYVLRSVQPNGTAILTVRNDGNIGIGNAAPGAKLDVTGTVRAGNADTNIGTHPTYGTSYSAFWRQGVDYSVLTNGSDSFFNAPAAAGNVYIRTANADKVFIQGSSGNVGIGNTNPGARLEVTGQVKITGGTPGAGKVLTSDAAGLATWQTPSSGSGLTITCAAGQTLTGITVASGSVTGGVCSAPTYQ